MSLPNKNSKAKREKCPYCGTITSYVRRHVRKYHPEISDEQLVLDFNGITELPKCLNPNCNNKVKPFRLGLPKFCSNKCQYEYYRLTGEHENGTLRISPDKYDCEGFIYIVKFSNIEGIKVGITTNYKGRFKILKSNLKSQLEFSKVFKVPKLIEASDFENIISKEFNKYRIDIGINNKWIGKSEWYSENVKDEIIERIDTLVRSSTTIEKQP